MKRKNKKIDIIDYNRKIIKEKLKNSLYVLSNLDKEILSIPQYQSLHKKKKKEIMNIQEDYVSFETAKLLKEKGFDEECYTCYVIDEIQHYDYKSRNSELITGIISAPTLQMAMKWLREIHNRYVEICMDKAHNFKDIVFRPTIYDNDLDCLWESDNFSTYEQACEAAIKHCLEHLI